MRLGIDCSPRFWHERPCLYIWEAFSRPCEVITTQGPPVTAVCVSIDRIRPQYVHLFDAEAMSPEQNPSPLYIRPLMKTKAYPWHEFGVVGGPGADRKPNGKTEFPVYLRPTDEVGRGLSKRK